jgi:fructose/tagatose bisphosphate aldolase
MQKILSAVGATETGGGDCIEVKSGRVHVKDESVLRKNGIDALVYTAVFGGEEYKPIARWLIRETALAVGIYPSSIHELYLARGRGALPHNFTTPAMNIRVSSFDTGRAAIRAALKQNVGVFIFEIARSEMTYTMQPPTEFVSVLLAAAIKEGFRGPLFFQGDHFQVNAKKYAVDAAGELNALKKLMAEAVNAGFYNIDIDTSTLVDLSKPDLYEQQRLNFELCAMFSDYIRSIEPQGVNISLGGEIGEVGHKNSDVHELRAFMKGFMPLIKHQPGLSKISVNTGTSHGGTVLPDGSIADVAIDFKTLGDLSVEARDYRMGGAVQHGASTLPENAFGKFAEVGAIEVHLATALQTVFFSVLPKGLSDDIDQWLLKNAADERKAGDTDAQFFHKTRKKATGVYKQQFWNLPEADRERIRAALEERFALYFNRLGVENTRSYVEKFVPVVAVHKTPEDYGGAPLPAEDVSGLAD